MIHDFKSRRIFIFNYLKKLQAYLIIFNFLGCCESDFTSLVHF